MTTTTSRSTQSLRTACLVLIVLGIFAAGFGIVQRIRAERSARAVDIVIDYPEVETLAAAQGIPVDAVLTRMREAGATSVALPEETLKTLEDSGAVQLSPGDHQADLIPQLQSGTIYYPIWNSLDPKFSVIMSDPHVYSFVVQGLQRMYPANSIKLYPGGIVIRGSLETVSEIGLGLLPGKVNTITRAGLRVAPRLSGQVGASDTQIRAILAAVAKALPAPAEGQPRGVIIFDGTTVLGYASSLKTLAEELPKHGLVYGCIEFGKQKGDAVLGSRLKGQLVRVHSISTEELATMRDVEAIQRFGLAVKDRNIRVLYIRFPQLSSNDHLADAARYVYGITREIRGMHGMGFTVAATAPAHPFMPLALPSWTLTLLFAGAGASILLWLVTILPSRLPRGYIRWGYALLALGVVGALASAVVMPAQGRIIFGLLAAFGFPLLALTYAYRRVEQLGEQQPVQVILPAVSALLITTGITLLGGLLIAAMMAETAYLVKVSQFAGVKAALALPLLLFAALLVTDGVARAGETCEEYCARCRQRIIAFLHQPLYLWGATIALVGLVAVGLMLARSGNDSGLGVSGMELKFRALLEQWLIARPRSKEFLLGFPLFIFAMAAAAHHKRTLALGLLLAAAIGQVDVLNTYCHAHTPVILSFLRTVNGLWLGILIGVVALVLFSRRARRPQPAHVEAVE